MGQIYKNKLNLLGYTQLVCDIFPKWEDVKDEILIPERKSGTGNGTIHVFLGAADNDLQKEFSTYYRAVNNGEDPSVGAIEIKHFFLASNVLSMLGYVCQYYYSKGVDPNDQVKAILSLLSSYPSENGLLQTSSLFKLSVGSSRLRPYFKQFDGNGVFTKLIRQLLLPNSGYKISLYKNENGEYAAFWLIGFDWQTDFEANSNKDLLSKKNTRENDKSSLQQIFYGAPGTGKSHSIKGDANVKEAEKGNRVFRTTFHPDSDYSTFVGCYKPSMKSGDKIYSAEELSVKLKEIKNTGVPYPCHKFAAKYWRSLKDLDPNSIKHILLACGFTEAYGVEVSKGIAIGQEFLNKDEDGKIIYTFTPQAFTNAYVKAWNTTENVYLIIEEINRGNCAQIFGDLFQLLDRGDDGKSEYPIDSDTDLSNYIAKELENSSRSDFPDGVKDGKKLVLPSNLYIWATMNTSDQSLFPIDSAFKRRWDWVYMPIGYKNTNWTIEIGDKKYEWVKFQRIINDKIYGVDNSEDKQLGDYFVNADRTNEKISADTLLNKVLFYIWNDVCKDDPDQIFQWVNDKKQNESIKFSDFFGVDKDKKLQGFMAYNKVPAIGETDNTDNAENTNIQEETPAENDNEINS